MANSGDAKTPSCTYGCQTFLVTNLKPYYCHSFERPEDGSP